MMQARKIISGLDIGSHKICCAIGQIGPDDDLVFLGVSEVPSSGVKNGTIVDAERACAQVAAAISRAEEDVGVKTGPLYVSISGEHIRGLNSRGAISINVIDNEITDDEMERAIDLAKAVSIPEQRERLHVIPQNFAVDDRDGISDPIGMSGERLEVGVHIVTASVAAAGSVLDCVKNAGANVQEMVFSSIAASEAVVTQEEKRSGAILIDIGAETVDLALYVEDSVWHTESLPVGGRNVTADIAYGLRLPMEAAEELKICQGSALISRVDPKEKLTLPDLGEFYQRRISRTVLAAIIEPRMEEIFRMAQSHLSNTPVADQVESVVLTGGGACTKDTESLAERIFGLPARLARPKLFDEDTCYSSPYGVAVAMGLLLHGFSERSAEIENPKFFGRLARKCESAINAILNI
jgi:cell division protein FtsA